MVGQGRVIGKAYRRQCAYYNLPAGKTTESGLQAQCGTLMPRYPVLGPMYTVACYPEWDGISGLILWMAEYSRRRKLT